MDLAPLAQFIPLGGATVLILSILGVWVQERRQWTIDRARLVEEHRRDDAEAERRHRQELEDRDADARRTIEYLRARVEELTEELEKVRAEQRAMRAELRDLRGHA